MPVTNYDPIELVIDQSTVSNPDVAGNTDGMWVRNESATVPSGLTRIRHIVPFEAGLHSSGGFAQNPWDYEKLHWLRFKIPLEHDSNRQIRSAKLELTWYPQPVYGDPTLPFEGNVGLADSAAPTVETPLQLDVRVYDTFPVGGDGGVPATQSLGNSWFDGASDHSTIIGVPRQHWINQDRGRIETKINFTQENAASVNLATDIQFMMDIASNWDPDDHITLLIEGINFIYWPPSSNSAPRRYVSFYTSSWIKHLISIGQLVDADLDKAPKLTLVYTQDTPKGANYTHAVEHAVTVQHTFGQPQDASETVEHILTLVQDPIGLNIDFARTVESILSVSQDVAGNNARDYDQRIYSRVNVIQDFSSVKEISKTVESIIVIEQTIESDLQKDIEHIIDVLHEWTNFKESTRTVESIVTPQSDINLGGDLSFSVEHRINVVSTVSNDTSVLANPQVVEHVINVISEIGVGANGVPNVVLQFDVEHTIEITSVIAGILFSDHRTEYHNTTGSLPAKPTLVPSGEITLDYPITSPTATVTLPAPLLSNQEELDKERIQRKTRGGDLVTFASDDWVDTVVFRMKFELLTDDQRTDMFTFLGASLGRRCRLTDHEGRTWDGVIRNPNGEHATFFALCGHTTEFDFEVTPNA